MVGDIDFIFSKKDYPKAIAILRDSGYSEIPTTVYYNSRPDFKTLQKTSKGEKYSSYRNSLEVFKRKIFATNLITAL